MISAFGLISAVVAIVAIVALVLHHKLMKRRALVDETFLQVDELMYFAEDETEEASDAILYELENALNAYNNSVKIYNEYISKFPGNVMALLVGFKKEKMMKI
jgi:hypothetical protein